MDATERREQILAAAMKLFEQGSYAGVSTADIATAAGVARPLIHHYFGTKRELYLEVVRRLSYIPAVAVMKGLSKGTLEERADSCITRYLTVGWRHRNMWTSIMTLDTPDAEVAEILRQADGIAADRTIEALGLTPENGKLHAMIVAYGGLAKAASRQWLAEQTLTRDEVHTLLKSTLLTIVRDVAGARTAHR
ncbi:TetR/AcrR family transcriptional regulator [Kutzneria sp. NPDC052558]|uniref:TetR/AcrR family transcriptional regulator n=1 Tax=Kutzneria sp. NPDC052558 TaxID=3364121 RepID=UPI0037C66B48